MFDTCTHKCGYCWLAESGQVLDFSQLDRFRDPTFIAKVTSFFLTRTEPQSKWLVQWTGGEPLISPSLDKLTIPLMDAGNQVAFYTALLVGHNHPGFRFLLDRHYPEVAYIMASFHPEAELVEAAYFEKIRMLKEAGHKVFLRFVGHPQRLNRLQGLSDRCQELDICFYPTTLLSNSYPRAYTPDETSMLRSHFSSLSQYIQLEGGLDTTNLDCYGGSRVIAINLQTGDITPCITVHQPSLGNIFENRLDLKPDAIRCPEPHKNCVCDVHFQQNILVSVKDHEQFESQRMGFVPPRDFTPDLDALRQQGLKFYLNSETGVGGVSNDSRLFYSADEIRENYRRARGLPRTSLTGKNLQECAGAVQKMQLASKRSRIDKGPNTRITTPPDPWAYAVAFPLHIPEHSSGSLWVRIRALVLKGEVGFGILSRAGERFQDRAFLAQDTGATTIFLSINEPNDVSSLIIQNGSTDGHSSELQLEGVMLLSSSA